MLTLLSDFLRWCDCPGDSGAVPAASPHSILSRSAAATVSISEGRRDGLRRRQRITITTQSAVDAAAMSSITTTIDPIDNRFGVFWQNVNGSPHKPLLPILPFRIVKVIIDHAQMQFT